MANITVNESYTFFDTVFSQSVKSLSRIIGVKNITRPFWNRWRASMIGDETITSFLHSIKSLEDWPRAASDIIDREESAYRQNEDRMEIAEKVQNLRRLSYLCHMAQWGCLELNDTKRMLYEQSRDYYIHAAELSAPGYFKRIVIAWKMKHCYANLHLPQEGPGPHPLIVILHGMDDTKEEHLATILHLQESGFAVLCADGPGQGESLLLRDVKWESDYCESILQFISVAVDEFNCDPERIGLLGISWGGMWAIKTAAVSPQVKAIYDLGGPIDTRLFPKLPFFLKTKFCQVLGSSNPKNIPDGESLFSIRDTAILEEVNCSVRIVHGGKDPIVPVKDKEWLLNQLKALHPRQDITMVVHDTGDHCCTRQAEECRQDVVRYFARTLN